MLTTELKLQDLFKLQFKECFYGNGINLEADILEFDESLGSLVDVAKNLYFRIDTGPFNYAYPGNSGWASPEPSLDRPFNPNQEEVSRPDNYVCWRLPQHERRLWQAGFPVYFGFLNGNKRTEMEIDSQTSEILKKDFD